MKRLICAVLTLCILGSFCLTGYAVEFTRDFNTTPGTISAEGQEILDRRPVLTVSCWVFAALLVVSLILLVIAIVRYRKASKNLRIFCTNLGWVKTMPETHVCVKISLLLLPANVILPFLLSAMTFHSFSQSASNGGEAFAMGILGSGVLSLLMLFLTSIVGLVLAIIGLPKSKQKVAGIAACIVHGCILAFFSLMAI